MLHNKTDFVGHTIQRNMHAAFTTIAIAIGAVVFAVPFEAKAVVYLEIFEVAPPAMPGSSAPKKGLFASKERIKKLYVSVCKNIMIFHMKTENVLLLK